MINKHKGGSIITDIKNIQNEMAYTTDDTYLFNYKNKKQELDKLLYKLSKYEKACKKRKQKKKNEKIKEKKNSIKKKINSVKKQKHSLKKKQDSIKKKEDIIKKEIKTIKKHNSKNKKHNSVNKKHNSKNKKHNSENKKTELKGGELINNIPNILFVPVIGPILYEKNKIELENNENVINDLLLYIINNLINTIELACIIYMFLNYNTLNIEEIFVIGIILIIRILSSIFVYKKKRQEDNNIKYNKNVNKFVILLVTGLPLLIMLFNSEKLKLTDNLILTFVSTILILPYFRILYNYLYKNNYNPNNAYWINIVEKIICGLIIYIIIKKNCDINSILDFIKNINNNEENSNIENINNVENNNIENINNNEENNNVEEDSEKESSENVLLNNFNNLFKKKYI